MNSCTNTGIQAMLPDLLHDSLAPAERERVEAHLAGCESCAEELDVLRSVRAAAVFVPTIDANRISRQIPPYRAIIPAQEHPARSRVATWLTAAAVLVVLAGGSLLMTRDRSSVPAVAVVPDSASRNPVVEVPRTVTEVASSESVPQQTSGRAIAPHTHALALAADVDGLTDGSLVQLMDDMNQFDALPAAEPEPVLAVDTNENIGQD